MRPYHTRHFREIPRLAQRRRAKANRDNFDGLHWITPMTKPLDQAYETVRRLAPHDQDAIAQAMLSLARSDSEPEPIDPAHLPDVLAGLAQARRREFATDVQVEAILRRFDP
jgi:hypothetical protein